MLVKSMIGVLTGKAVIHNENDTAAQYVGTGETAYYIEGTAREGISASEIEWALKKAFPKQNCSHAYDCCGNWYQEELEIFWSGSRRFIVRVEFQQNY